MIARARRFEEVSLEDSIKHAGENIKHTVDSLIRESQKDDQNETKTEAEPPRTQKPASGTKPVDVELPDDSDYNIKEDEDGFHEASIG